MTEYLAGFSEITITPPPGVEMAGYSNRAGPAEGVHDELKAIAAVFDDRSGQKSVLCAVDVCSLPAAVADSVRKRISFRIATRPERVILAATHTHSGPSLTSKNVLNQRWRRTLVDRLARVIQEADLFRRPVQIGAATGRVEGIGGNRRNPKRGPVDRTVTVLRVDDVRAGRLLGVIVNHACHATTLDLSNLKLSADYPGFLREIVQTGLEDRPTVLFFNGACGDINPGGYSAEDSALGKTIPNRTFARAAEIGAELGAEALRLVSGIRTEPTFRVRSGALTVSLPMRAFPVPADALRLAEEAETRLNASEKEGVSGAELDRRRLDAMYARTHVVFAERFMDAPNGEWPAEVQGVAVGDILFLGLPGEVFNEIGARIKSASPFAHTFLIGYANAGVGYIPTAAALRDGGYEVKASMFGEAAVQKFEGWAVLLARGLHASLAQADHAAAESPDSAPTKARENPDLQQPMHDVRRARFPAIDFHMHTPGSWRAAQDKLRTMDETNVRVVVDMFGDCMRDGAFEPCLRFAAEEQGRILHFSGLDFSRIDAPDWPDYVREKIEHDVGLGARGIKLFKEVGLFYRDAAGRRVQPDDPRLAPIWQGAADVGLPVLYHIADPIRNFAPVGGTYEELRAQDDFSLFWRFGAPGFPTHAHLIECEERLIAQYPDTTFVLPHLAALDGDLARLGAWLRAYPNVYVDTSARLYELGSQPYTAREFLMAFPDRVLWGTDLSWPNRDDGYHAWFRFLETRDEGFAFSMFGSAKRFIHGIGLPDDVLRKLYGTNAARVLGIDPAELEQTDTAD